MKTIPQSQQRAAVLCSLVIHLHLEVLRPAQAATNVVVWDTGARLAEVNRVESRAGWKQVPSELFSLEAEPSKAASDPGYYGREYRFEGDTVVENQRLAAVFSSDRGRMVLFAKRGAESRIESPPENAGLGKRILEIAARQGTTTASSIEQCEVLRNAGDEIVLRVSFSSKGSAKAAATFSFGRDEIVQILPSEGMRGIRLFSPLAYGVVPGFIGDDLLFGPAEYASAETLHLPVENIFVGLLTGEAATWVMTWPSGKQQLRLGLATDPQGARGIESVDFDSGGQALYLAASSAPGIWHREELKPAYLEKDVALAWQPPFAAHWKTQLTEAGVKTAFAFRESKGTIWRGVPGSFEYPAWFDGNRACLHLSKKVPPRGESIIYFLEGHDTPLSIPTPADILKATLGRQSSDAILDSAGRKLRTHHRRGGAGVHRACTCGCTEFIQAVFETGQEVAKKNEIKAALDDMIFFVECHVERIDEYRRFASDMIQLLQAQETAVPGLSSFVSSLRQTVQQIPQEYEVQKENMKTPEYVAELTRDTLALTANSNANNLAAYMELFKAWRAMGGAQDYVLAQCHVLTRKLFQEAGYRCANDPHAVTAAKEIRARCRQVLRNPDGYEIWANY